MVSRILPKSIRKYIRREKARIRRQISDLNEQRKLIDQLYKKFLPKARLEIKNKSNKL